MMMPNGLNFSAMWMLWCCCLMPVKGHDVCQRILIHRFNLTTELQSEILLTCLFEPACTESVQSADTSVVWSQITTTVLDIVEITVSDEIRFWNSRGNRIKGFRYRPGSGNFSILIQNVQKSDLGLYRCELYREVNCSLGYQEISLAVSEFSLFNNWQLILGGGFLLLCLIIACGYYTWRKRQRVLSSAGHSSHNCHDSEGQTVEKTDDITYTTVVHKPHNCHEGDEQTDKTIYTSVNHRPHNCHDSSALVSDNNTSNVSTHASDRLSTEAVLYATVKERENRR